ncbi:hypothetical protein SCHPADRAFT_947923 [Schizopora paradoxa]|uniref:Uncharacterized protein n=1 Tax=Schizopora paradoxa TaxID=27342 RepID=A0A0H2RGZ2_9AGAM|nr:hypothetical protein SCHPADRAFT_947923 [Schizopora paradoxa]
MDLSRGLHSPFIRRDKPFARNATHETPNAMRTYICCFCSGVQLHGTCIRSNVSHLLPTSNLRADGSQFPLRLTQISSLHLREHVCMPLLRILRRPKLLRKITGSMLDINILTSCSVLARFVALNAVHSAGTCNSGLSRVL